MFFLFNISVYLNRVINDYGRTGSNFDESIMLNEDCITGQITMGNGWLTGMQVTAKKSILII